MRIGVVCLIPEMLAAVTDWGISGRAVERGLLDISAYNPRAFVVDAHRTVDDRPYGGGPGMVMMYAPLRDAIGSARRDMPGARVCYLSPQGRSLRQSDMAEMSRRQSLILVAGRYEGVDERVIENLIDEQISLGDYVLSGGELGAMVIIDAICRLLPGALGDECSATDETFAGGLLEYPQYTRPEEVDGHRVPSVLLSGNHDQIRRWRLKQALGRTWQRRPDLLERFELTTEQGTLLAEFVKEQGGS